MFEVIKAHFEVRARADLLADDARPGLRCRIAQEKGLVRQQLDSFGEFATNTLQEVVTGASISALRLTAQ